MKISAEPPLHDEVSKTYKKMNGTMTDNHIYIIAHCQPLQRPPTNTNTITPQMHIIADSHSYVTTTTTM
jgi:hypothetical protein